MAVWSVALKACLLFAFVEQCQCRIGMRGGSRSESISIESVDNNLLSEMANALGQSSMARINRIEDQMRPMYTALPKTSDGTLNKAGVRYALHRFFVHLHGWHVKGLEPDGNSWNTSSPTEMLKDRVPAHIVDLVEQHLDGHGFGLHELAVLAATLDDLIHSEAIERLTKAYAAHGVSVDETTTKEKADLILQTYMVFMILPNEKLLKLNSNQLQRLLPKIPKVYPGWDDTVMWVRDLQKSIEYNERMERNPFTPTEDFDFAAVVKIIEEVNAQFGQFQDRECRSMKWSLLDMEVGDSGRVLLSTFYGTTLDGGWQFKESQEYLRDLGALDESDPQRPSVVIPNYLNGRSNCIATSSFYSVCCIDECEGIMVKLENHIASPYGSPNQIAEVIGLTHSDTVDAPRNLSSTLLSRLDIIASQHGGRVPLHGRLFAQWMHHAYPHECPMPQAAGSSTAPMTPNEWMQATGKTRSFASSEEMTTHVEDSKQRANEPSSPAELPWSEEEELVMILDTADATNGLSNTLRNFACLAVLTSAAISLWKTSNSALSELPVHNGGKRRNSHFV